jgi:hypothetical protein
VWAYTYLVGQGRKGKAVAVVTRRHCGCAVDTRSDFAETDLHILTFDVPDDVLERAAGAELAITLVHCTNPLVWECPAMDGSHIASSDGQ